MTRHFLELGDLSPAELYRLLDRSEEFKRLRGTPRHPTPLAGKSVAVLMEKASTRTRVSFEVGIVELGGHPVCMAGRDTQLGRGETFEDTARVLSRLVHCVVLRTHGHERIEALAAASDIPYINALTDKCHPCQLLADLMTVRQHVDRDLSALRVAWVGDGNNMARSWIAAAQSCGFELRLACPEGYAPDPQELSASNSHVQLTSDVAAAVKDADVVTTDVWTSMGQEDEAARRRVAFASYGVTGDVMELAAPRAIFLHCLPAHRGEEVAAEVIDGPASRVWDETENRLHTQKALLEFLCGS